MRTLVNVLMCVGGAAILTVGVMMSVSDDMLGGSIVSFIGGLPLGVGLYYFFART